jgi:flagellar assembly factor FliW
MMRHDVAMSGAPATEEPPPLVFATGVPGFPDAHRFTLGALDEAGTVYALRCLDDPGLRFIAVPPIRFFPDYRPELPDDVVAELHLRSADDAVVLLIVTCTDSLDDATANLLAPVVINVRTRDAAQVVLNGSDFPLRAPLPHL